MSSTKHIKTVFNIEWTDRNVNPDISSWIAEVPHNPYAAQCIICNKTFSLSNMGKQAVTSHARSVKHKKNESSKSETSILNFLPKRNEKNTSEELPHESLNISSAARQETAPPEKKNMTMSDFISKENCFKAEVIWAMKLVMSHSSFNSFNDAAEIFRLMFSDSETAKKCTLGRAKMSYLVTYGLSPYFHQHLQKSVLQNQFVVCFDEALNQVSQRCQMDIIIRYWSDSSNRVSTRYWNSVFLGRTTAEDLITNFRRGIEDLNVKMLVQVSMDGPNVNLKFLRLLKEELLVENNSHILDLGTCGLHIVHGAFQYGHRATKWKLNVILRAFYRLFKDSPTRRATYTEITGSSEFPLKFCEVRWVENTSVCERAITIFDNIKKYLESSKNLLPRNFTCDSVEESCKDDLILAKLSFFAFVSSIMEPFLRKFQSPKPMVPFLYEELFELVRQLMTKFFKREIMEKVQTLEHAAALDVEDKNNIRKVKDVDIGISATRYLHKNNVSDAQKFMFRSECLKFLKASTKKMLERTSNNFSVLRAMSCLNPVLIRTNPVLCEKRMNTLLQILHDKDKITTSIADRAKHQFETFCFQKVKNEYKEAFLSFTNDVRLDDFYALLFKTEDCKELWCVIRLVLILSHGNASVESGFSINKDMLIENLHEDSIKGLRTVYDTVKEYGGITDVPLTKELLNYARQCRIRYHRALDEKKKEKENETKNESKKRKITDQIKLLQQKRVKLLGEKSAEISKLDEQIAELSKTKNLI